MLTPDSIVSCGRPPSQGGVDNSGIQQPGTSAQDPTLVAKYNTHTHTHTPYEGGGTRPPHEVRYIGPPHKGRAVSPPFRGGGVTQ